MSVTPEYLRQRGQPLTDIDCPATGKRCLSFTRRRYGSQTYTWADVWNGAEWISLGDPWPCITPKRAELIAAADTIPMQPGATAPEPEPQPEQTYFPGTPEYDAACRADLARIEGERLSLQFKQASSKRLDKGKRPITDAPLFGGESQEDLF